MHCSWLDINTWLRWPSHAHTQLCTLGTYTQSSILAAQMMSSVRIRVTRITPPEAEREKKTQLWESEIPCLFWSCNRSRWRVNTVLKWVSNGSFCAEMHSARIQTLCLQKSCRGHRKVVMSLKSWPIRAHFKRWWIIFALLVSFVKKPLWFYTLFKKTKPLSTNFCNTLWIVYHSVLWTFKHVNIFDETPKVNVQT